MPGTSDSPQETAVQRYRRLMEIARDLTSTLDLGELLRRITREACDLSRARAASILLYDAAANQLYFEAATNEQESRLRGVSVPMEGSLAGWIIANNQPAVVPDVRIDTRPLYDLEKNTQIPTLSIIGVPLVHKGQTLGVLEVINKLEGEFSEADLEILMVLAAQAAVALQNARLFQQSDLISELVHELRTPLSSLYTASYLLQRPDISDVQRTRLASTVHQEIQRLNDLASSFLDLARLESRRAGFRFADFNVLPLLEECREVLSAKADENRIQISIHVPAGLPPLFADRDKIKQVVLNLLSNAVKYNRSDGRVDMEAFCQDRGMVLRIRDTGIGIPADGLPHLFEKFYRGPGAERVAGGTGLGLSICKRIVEGHHGRISADSIPGEGTTFTVFLPA